MIVAERDTTSDPACDRFFRSFKEQVVYGRIYQTIDNVRAAVRAFFERYNHEWLIEKNGPRSPLRKVDMQKIRRPHQN